MQMSTDLTLQLQDVKSAMYERMAHAAKLDLVTIDGVIDLISQGHQLHCSLSSKKVGILNEISVPPIAFSSWLLTQDSGKRDDLQAAILMQSLALKSEMLDAAVASVEELSDLSNSGMASVKEKIAASTNKATTALRVLDALSIEHAKHEKAAPIAGKQQIKASITSSDEARARLLQLREQKNAE